MKAVVGIPARMGSSRLPGKPLASILGTTMVEHVYKRCLLAQGIDDIFVATCDNEIADVVEGFGGKAIMTDKDIPRPGLRVARACQGEDLDDDDIVVVVQGDEPLIYPAMIELAVQALRDDPGILAATMVADASEDEWLDPDEVKVVSDTHDDILYMSRSPIPSNTRDRITQRLKQVAIMPFQKRFLLDFYELSETPLEVAESIELLRAVEHGVKVRTITSTYRTVSVDTEEDRQEAEDIMGSDSIFARYQSKEPA